MLLYHPTIPQKPLLAAETSDAISRILVEDSAEPTDTYLLLLLDFVLNLNRFLT